VLFANALIFFCCSREAILLPSCVHLEFQVGQFLFLRLLSLFLLELINLHLSLFFRIPLTGAKVGRTRSGSLNLKIPLKIKPAIVALLELTMQ
jgi:hypothetical protein